jgi:hypothetical protein
MVRTSENFEITVGRKLLRRMDCEATEGVVVDFVAEFAGEM